MKNNNIATYDPRQVVFFQDVSAKALDYPIFRSPDGKMFTCIGYAVQTEQPSDPKLMNLTEWYLFNEGNRSGEVEYFALEQGVANETFKTVRKRDLESIPGVTITEHVETLNGLLPPEGWEKIR